MLRRNDGCGVIRGLALRFYEEVGRHYDVPLWHVKGPEPHVAESVFAAMLNVPPVTAISWEKGRRSPSGAALRLLEIVRKHPAVLVTK